MQFRMSMDCVKVHVLLPVTVTIMNIPTALSVTKGNTLATCTFEQRCYCDKSIWCGSSMTEGGEWLATWSGPGRQGCMHKV